LEEDDEWTRERTEEYIKKMEKVSKRVYESFAREILGYIEEHGMDNRLTVLDLGCGPGFLILELKRMKSRYRIIGVDPSESMLEIAERRAAEWGIEDFEARVGTAEKIPLSDMSVGIVVCRNSLHEWKDREKGVREVHRVLKEGGLFIIRDPNRGYPKWKLALSLIPTLITSGVKQAKNRYKSYNKWLTHTEAKQLLQRHQFSIEHLKKGRQYTLIGRKKH